MIRFNRFSERTAIVVENDFIHLDFSIRKQPQPEEAYISRYELGLLIHRQAEVNEKMCAEISGHRRQNKTIYAHPNRNIYFKSVSFSEIRCSTGRLQDIYIFLRGEQIENQGPREFTIADSLTIGQVSDIFIEAFTGFDNHVTGRLVVDCFESCTEGLVLEV